MISKKLNLLKFKRNIPIKSDNNSVLRLPVEILLKIFDYLSPKQLCACSLVCKQWFQVASSNEVWRKVFQFYHINKPVKEIVTFKEEYIKRGRDFIKKRLMKDICIRRKQHIFPKFEELRKLDASIMIEIFDKRLTLLTRNSQKLKANISESGSDVTINLQKKISNGQFPILADIESITITVLIPGLINNLVPINDTMNHHVKIWTMQFGKLFEVLTSRNCNCQKNFQFLDATIEWHFCISTFLIGVWPNDLSIAYFSFLLPLIKIQEMVERLLISDKNVLKTCSKTLSERNLNLSEPDFLKFLYPNSLMDLKCTLLIENMEPSELLLYNCWRSVDYLPGMSLNLICDSDKNTHQQIKEKIEFKPSIGHLHIKYKNIVKVAIIIVDAVNDPIWSYSSAVVLSSSVNQDVDFLYPNSHYGFANNVIKGTMTTDNNGRLYLTQFCIL